MKTKTTYKIVMAAVVVVLAVGQSPAKAETILKTWAVISSAKLQKAGLTDLLTVALAREKGIKLVERDQLRLVAKELALSKMFGSSGVAQRAGAGRILKADALILLTDETKDGKNFVKLVISDCRCGARLRVDYLPFVPEKIKPLAGKLLGLINETRSRFPDGIKHVFGVPHFVSRNLAHDYDHFQAGFANLLGNALASMPGVAVIETEEAHRIRREIDLTDGADVKRIVPLFIEGEFKVLRPAKAKGPTVTFSLKITDGARTVKTISPKTVKFSKAGTFLREDVPRQILQIRKNHVKRLSVDEQFAALVSRADTFARLGFWKDATGLREAALLLKDDPCQRKKAIDEYRRIVGAPLPGGMRLDARTKAYGKLCTVRWAAWHIAIHHLEYLIRNRQTDARQAAETAGRLFDSERCTCLIRFAAREELAGAERTRKQFLRNCYPLICQLTYRGKPSPYFWRSVYSQISRQRMDRKRLGKEDLDFYLDMMEKVIPEDDYSRRTFSYYPSDFTGGYVRVRFSREEFMEFLDRLEKSKRPINVIIGRYGKLHLLWSERKKSRKPADDLLVQAVNLLASLNAVPECRGQNRSLCDGIKRLRNEIWRSLKPKRVTHGLPRVSKKPVPKIFQITYEQIPFQVKDLSGKLSPLKGKRWRTPGGYYGGFGLRLLNCDGKMDVVWGKGVVMFHRSRGILQEVFVEQEASFSDAKWDGENVWIAARSGNLRVVSPAGKVLVKITSKHGLPPCDRKIMLHPIEPGKVCAIGSFGPHRRAWCAMVELKKDGPHVNVFHKATRVKTDKKERSSSDADYVFSPAWIHELRRRQKNPRVLLVGRSGHSLVGGVSRYPLQINLRTLAVSVSETKFFRRNISQSIFSRNGQLLQIGNHNPVLMAKPGEVFENGKKWKELSRCKASGGSFTPLLYWKGRIYVPGWPWFRINPDTWTADKLISARLPVSSMITRYGISAFYGMIVWGGSQDGMYRVVMKGDRPDRKTRRSGQARENIVKQPTSRTSK